MTTDAHRLQFVQVLIYGLLSGWYGDDVSRDEVHCDVRHSRSVMLHMQQLYAGAAMPPELL